MISPAAPGCKRCKPVRRNQLKVEHSTVWCAARFRRMRYDGHVREFRRITGRRVTVGHDRKRLLQGAQSSSCSAIFLAGRSGDPRGDRLRRRSRASREVTPRVDAHSRRHEPESRWIEYLIGAGDETYRDYGPHERFVLLTNDLDFPQNAAQTRDTRPSVILLRGEPVVPEFRGRGPSPGPCRMSRRNSPGRRSIARLVGPAARPSAAAPLMREISKKHGVQPRPSHRTALLPVAADDA